MKLYDQIFDVVKQFKKLFSPGPVTNADVSGSLTAEMFLIVSLILSAILLRHINKYGLGLEKNTHIYRYQLMKIDQTFLL